MHCGIEFEYLLVDARGETQGRIRDFSNLEWTELTRMLGDKPGYGDERLRTGDLGIRSGYWYLEGDERFDEQGCFRTLVVKGIEIRTPPAPSVRLAVQELLDLERALRVRLAEHDLDLAICSYHPQRARYVHEPPLNAWEQRLRGEEREYDGSLVSTLTFGPDINLSMPGWDVARVLSAARKLNAYAPYIVPFSFNSPYYAGARWPGWSKRTYERAGQRPVVKVYIDPDAAAAAGVRSSFLHEARSVHEHGRIEFKPFDAVPSARLLTACAQLLVGLCLDEQLPERSEDADVALYRHIAAQGFADDQVVARARELLECAQAALERHAADVGNGGGDKDPAQDLEPLRLLLQQRQTPAHALLNSAHPMFWPGGLADNP